jgi:carbonic anhydrase
MSVLEEIVAANSRYAATLPTADRQAPPTRRIAVLACMDARLRPEDALGLSLGEAHVIRNAGGRATDDAIRSLTLSSRLLGTRAFVVMHHTDCGLLGTTNDEIHSRIQEETGADVRSIDFLPFSDARQALIDDVERLRSAPSIDASIPVVGVRYDVRSGEIEVTAP